MRRTVLLPMLAVVALVGGLLPAAALGLLGGPDPAADVPSAVPAAPSAVGSTSETASSDASGPGQLASSGKRAAPTADRPAARTLDLRPADARVDPAIDPAVDHPERHIRLGCALVRADIAALTDALSVRPAVAPAIACRWTAVDADAVRGYQLWRAVDAPDGGPRELIATIPAGDPQRYVDSAVSRGHIYTYAVIAVAGDGSKIAVSDPVAVKVPPVPDVLRLACELTTDGDLRGVACKWSKATQPAAAYVLWRSVDGGPREAIYKTGPDGRLSYLDTRIKAGHTIRYAVVALDRTGRIVGFGGPLAVRIPPPADTLRMACELAIVGDRRGVACKWTAAMHPAAAGYILWRTVDDGPREAIYRTGLDGRRGFLDPEVEPGQTIRYVVTVVDRTGHVVGHGGPILIRIPDLTPRGG